MGSWVADDEACVHVERPPRMLLRKFLDPRLVTRWDDRLLGRPEERARELVPYRLALLSERENPLVALARPISPWPKEHLIHHGHVHPSHPLGDRRQGDARMLVGAERLETRELRLPIPWPIHSPSILDGGEIIAIDEHTIRRPRHPLELVRIRIEAPEHPLHRLDH
ncbi:hypothetical protein [Halorubellus salinus]|uniref:hypothetical protein n=1 Tax=Halorubellus salinus TaxID=755309 RepID=UPI001D05C49F|nr:hypothetical protein [Halorubellus salinus]